MANPVRDLINVTPGTARADSPLVVDSNKRVDLDMSTIKIDGTEVTATAAELNIMDGVTATAAEINRSADVSARIVAVTTTPISLTAASHDGKWVTLSKVDGITLTLPAASGSGVHMRFVVVTTVTSVGYKVQVANASDVMTGMAHIAQDGGDTHVVFETASTSDTITLNGSTTGGIKGDYIELIDVATNLWYVRCHLSGTGAEETPFSAAV